MYSSSKEVKHAPLSRWAEVQGLSKDGLLEAQALLDEQQHLVPHDTARRIWSRSTFWLCCGQVLFFLTSLSMLLLSIDFRRNNEIHEAAYAPVYSPAEESVRDTAHLRRFDGTFGASGTYKGTPSPEIDEAWDRITYRHGGIFSVSEDTMTAVNASKEYTVELSEDLGGGYMASVEVLHQLHCLNMLRQATYEDYYKTRAGQYKDSPETLRRHVDHCIDILRQKLMCDADTGILTYVWVKGHESPYPDFNVQHKCRDFWAVIRWVEQHQLYTPTGSAITRLPGAGEMEDPP